MKKKLADQYIRYALEYLDKNKNLVSKDFESKVSSFGPTVYSVGVLPTVCIYDDNESRRVVNGAIWSLLERDPALQKTSDISGLKDYVVKSKDDRQLKRERILAASVALKLAVRTYDLPKDSKEGGPT